MVFCDWLLSFLSIMFSILVHFVECIGICLMTNDVEHLLMAYKPLRVKSPSRKVVELGLKARIYTQLCVAPQPTCCQ